jgi:hypothetical protein
MNSAAVASRSPAPSRPPPATGSQPTSRTNSRTRTRAVSSSPQTGTASGRPSKDRRPHPPRGPWPRGTSSPYSKAQKRTYIFGCGEGYGGRIRRHRCISGWCHRCCRGDRAALGTERHGQSLLVDSGAAVVMTFQTGARGIAAAMSGYRPPCCPSGAPTGPGQTRRRVKRWLGLPL